LKDQAILKLTKYFLILILPFILGNCGASFGEKYTKGNLEIYYTQNVGEHYVIKLGDYFEQNDLIQPKKHSLQLTSDSKSFILKMVLNASYASLPEEQFENLSLLENEIKKSVFNDLNFRIEVCDINFNPIKKSQIE